MKYFSALPKVVSTDINGNNQILTNLLVRVNVIPDLLKNPLLFYSYDIKDGETPEIIASKYYGSVDNFWVVMFSNQLMDPQWSWPLSYSAFNSYIIDKYGSIQNAQSQLSHYEKKIVKTDTYGNLTNDTEIIIIDAAEFANTTVGTSTSTFDDGDVLNITVSAYPVYQYDNELSLNEAKRNIKLLNVSYLNNIQSQLKSLLK